MKKLDRFILKSFIGPFVAILMVVVFILAMQTLWLYIDELVGKGLGLRTILEFLFWGVCSLALPLALPLATLLASTMTVGQLAERSELMAIRAAGISVGRVMAPIAVAAALIACGTYFVCSRLVPHAFNEIYTLRDDISRTKDEIKIPPGTFYNGIDGYILRVGDQDKQTKVLYDVQVYDHTAHKGNISVTMADSALLKISKSKDYLTFTLFHGSTYREDNTLRYNDTSLVLQHIDFARQELLIPLKNYSFEKSDSARFDDAIKSKQMTELRHLSDSLRHELDSIHNVNYRMVRYNSALQEIRQLDTAFYNPNRSYYSNPEYLQWDGPDAAAQARIRAAENVQRFSSDINSFRFNTFDKAYNLRQSDLSFLEKYGQALACFLLFFIGAPLGALVKSKRGGLGVSLIISVLFFVLYYVVNISGSKLARDGAVETPIGVFISAAVIAPIGIFFTWKAMRDAELFNMDQFTTWWRRIKSKVVRLFRPVRIVYMGTPEFAVKPLDTLVQAGYKIVGVVTVADKPAGRGLKVNESAVKQYAVAHGIPVLQPVKLKDPEFLEALRAWKADMFVVVAFRMLPEAVWNMPVHGTFNLHASLLPAYRGAAPINHAIINGDTRTGVTTFLLNHQIDEGQILLQAETPISPDDNAGTLHDRLALMGRDLVVRTLDGIQDRTLTPHPQEGTPTAAPKIFKDFCLLDLHQPAQRVVNLIRGLSPYPAALLTLVNPQGEEVLFKVFDAVALSDPEGTPGALVCDEKKVLKIGVADGFIQILSLQMSGKRKNSVEDFLRGNKLTGWKTKA